jgi:hypothetical protein
MDDDGGWYMFCRIAMTNFHVHGAAIIIIIKEGTDTSQGKAQLISQLIYEGQNITISNNSTTIMKLLDVVHPAARMG